MIRWKTRPRKDGEVYVVLDGDITEGESLRDLNIQADRAVFNLSRVRYINSEGSRRLLQFLDGLHGVELIGELASPAVVELMNMVPVLAKKIRIESVIVPIECPECMHESDIRVRIPSGGGIPPMELPPCDDCGATTELAVLEDRYFAFASAPVQ